MTNEFIAARLREAREAAGLSQNGLAEKIGIHKCAVQGYERGDVRPSYKRYMELCAAMGADPLLLIGEPPENAFPRPGESASGPAAGTIGARLLKGNWKGMTDAQIAACLHCSTNSVRGWIRKLEGVYGVKLEYKSKADAKAALLPASYCSGCLYWGNGSKSCSYIIYTGKRKEKPVNGKCPSRKNANGKALPPLWASPAVDY